MLSTNQVAKINVYPLSVYTRVCRPLTRFQLRLSVVVVVGIRSNKSRRVERFKSSRVELNSRPDEVATL